MPNSTAAFTENSSPYDHTDTLDKRELFGTIAVSKTSPAGTTYPTHGIPVSFASALPYSNNNFFWGEAQGTGGYVYILDPTYQTLRAYIVTSASSAPLAEVSTTTPDGVAADTIYARVIVERT